jgi:hypothetical protein
MNISQANLYEVLDAFCIDAKVGKGVFKITKDVHIDNGYIDVSIRFHGLHIRETVNGLYAIMRVGDLGIIAISKSAELKSVCIFDFKHPTADAYHQTEDWNALLNHLSEDEWRSEFVIEYIVC